MSRTIGRFFEYVIRNDFFLKFLFFRLGLNKEEDCFSCLLPNRFCTDKNEFFGRRGYWCRNQRVTRKASPAVLAKNVVGRSWWSC